MWLRIGVRLDAGDIRLYWPPRATTFDEAVGAMQSWVSASRRRTGMGELDRRAAARYVLSRRTPEGGFCFYRTPVWGVEEPNTPDTLAALASLSLLGIAPPAPAVTARWLRSVQDDDGGFPALTIGWAALRALELLGMSPHRSPRAWLMDWGRRLLSARRAEARDWHVALESVSHVAELLDLGSGQRDGVAGLLAASADPRGGWARPGADMQTTAMAVQLAHRAAIPAPDRDKIDAFLCGCEHPALGIQLRPDAQVTTVGALWGGLAVADALGVLPRYPAAVSASLALLQGPDGGLGARHGAVSTLRDTWHGLCAATFLDELDTNESEEQPS